MVPIIINAEVRTVDEFPVLDEREIAYIEEAKNLFAQEFYSYSLLAIWNAAVNNMRRKVEAYGVDLWKSVVKDEPGRKKYKDEDDSLIDRWKNVDDLVLIKGATRLGILNPKAGKSIEMINWMRSHASPSHGSDNRVEREDATGLILMLQKNLFEQSIPEPGHSVSSLFDPIKSVSLTPEAVSALKDQITALKQSDVRTAFGFFVDLYASGESPAVDNIAKLFPVVWEKATADLRKTLGIRYYNLLIDEASDDSDDKGAKTRLFELLIAVGGLQFIPDAARARIYRRAARRLRDAKDTSYGWGSEVAAAEVLLQMGTHIPSVAFEEVYQEILTVWCGNYWGRSDAYKHLDVFIETLNTNQIRRLLRMFMENERVQEELGTRKPRNEALRLIKRLRDKLTIVAHQQEAKAAFDYVKVI